MPRVSIVLPTYNGEKYISQAIESIMWQTFRDFELIIVNDCSTDRTREIIGQFAKKDKRIRFLDNEHNQKLPRSLNRGFSVAKGELFTWTSDDNLYKENALEVMVSRLDENPAAGMIYCDMELIDENGENCGTKRVPEPELFYQGDCVGACFMYRAVLAKEVGGYDANMFLAEDYDYWLRLFAKAPMITCHESLYQYRIHNGSLTATRHDEIMNQNARLWVKHLELLVPLIPSYREKQEFFKRILLSASDEDKQAYDRLLCAYSKRFRLYRIRKRFTRKLSRIGKRK